MPDRATILDTILAHKHMEVAARRARVSRAELQARMADLPRPRDFAGALQTPKVGPVALIAEIKKASPSAGLIRADFDPVQIAQIYERSGADCLSVLTDERFFQGRDDFLQAVRRAVFLPLLRKDFIVDSYQVYEARALGADAVLLIAASLTPAQITDYGALAQELGMAALVEVHTEEEMNIAMRSGATLIGINSRNLKTFVTDLDTVQRLANLVPPGVTLVAESGIKTLGDVQRVARAGAKAILVGETLMRALDISQAITELLGGA
jgi:indole-3-glycerol phosphate synthase